MAIDSHYIPAFSIEEVLLDKDTGAPLSGGIVTFERALQPGTLKPVFQITGTDPNYSYTQLPNPMILSSIGTFEDTLGNPVVPYFFPYNGELEPDYYRVIVESSGEVPQFVRDPVPYIPSSGMSNIASAYENEISNPQFAEVLFDTSTSTHIYTFSAPTSLEVVNIAPDWDLIVSCSVSGTVTVSQIKPTGALNILTNPGTILNINSAGLSRLRLRQRLYGSPNLWGSGFLAGTFIAKTYGGTAATVTMYYSQSNGTVTDQIISTGILNGDGTYAAHPGSVAIPASDSTENFPDAYVDIEFNLPLSVEIDISSIMVAFTGAVSISEMVYSQDSQNRQIDHLFHYYQPLINYKPIPSLLTGWDFGLNPAQFGSSGNITGTPGYLWDQTIGARGATNIAYSRNSAVGGIQFTTAGAVPDAFMILQYLTGAEAKRVLGTPLSVNLNAFRTPAGGNVTFRIYLFRGSSAAVIPTLGNLIGGLSSTGVFTLNTTAGQGLNWSYIQRGDLSDTTGVASGSLSVINTNADLANGENDYGFSGWEVTDATEIGDTDKFAIIVTFNYVAISSVVIVDSVSVVPGLIPTRPATKTLNDTILECQYYYQKSFLTGTTPAQNVGSNTGESFGIQVSGAGSAGAFGPIPRFPTSMRATPTVVLYNPSAANAQIRDIATGTDWSTSSVANVNTQGFVAIGSTPGGSAAGNGMSVHWTADARLGLV